MYSIDPPKGVIHIIDVLTGHGYEAYAVGGCVRDSVMGRLPKDWDITTNACPQAVKGFFERTLDTGLSHGTVTVMIGRESYEVTTFRIDGKYEDGRHPEYVEFTLRLEDDLKRRDFTINSMAWNTDRGIIDLFGGMSDIAARIVRAVGDPGERFREDALRMLRAVRFAARLGFDIEEYTYAAIKNNCGLIKKISAERIREELTGILTSEEPAKFRLLAETGLLGQILSKFGYSFGTSFDQSESSIINSRIKAVDAVEADLCLRWTMLLRCFTDPANTLKLADEATCNDDACNDAASSDAASSDAASHDAAPYNDVSSAASYDAAPYGGNFLESAEDILRKLKFSNKCLERILRLLKYADMQIGSEPGDIAKAVASAGEDIFRDIIAIKKAVALTCDTASGPERIEYINGIEKIYFDLLTSGRCLNIKDLAIDGRDLIRLGYSEGSGIGKALAYLLDCVLKESELNRKTILEKMALDYLSRK